MHYLIMALPYLLSPVVWLILCFFWSLSGLSQQYGGNDAGLAEAFLIGVFVLLCLLSYTGWLIGGGVGAAVFALIGGGTFFIWMRSS